MNDGNKLATFLAVFLHTFTNWMVLMGYLCVFLCVCVFSGFDECRVLAMNLLPVQCEAGTENGLMEVDMQTNWEVYQFGLSPCVWAFCCCSGFHRYKTLNPNCLKTNWAATFWKDLLARDQRSTNHVETTYKRPGCTLPASHVRDHRMMRNESCSQFNKLLERQVRWHFLENVMWMTLQLQHV